jgi:hypothetical protein
MSLPGLERRLGPTFPDKLPQKQAPSSGKLRPVIRPSHASKRGHRLSAGSRPVNSVNMVAKMCCSKSKLGIIENTQIYANLQPFPDSL